ncbi:hypothetical protein BHE90_003549 [Fusarium euwallaceae]|uniref:Uncharacterized protein n=1 Tax=Fusarium euwallaceae TaxID=1147111 RepID=A0A430M1T7_9HYPO|nr:hypothetical protein BHE90_003549 [Fusarium euwallaceae]
MKFTIPLVYMASAVSAILPCCPRCEHCCPYKLFDTAKRFSLEEMLGFASCLADRGVCSENSTQSVLETFKIDSTLYDDTLDNNTADAVAICILEAEGTKIMGDAC